MREIFNPYNQPKAVVEVAVASNESTEAKGDIAVASAMSNVDPSMCPKCGVKMGTAFLYDRRAVYYCDPCRVTHPTE